MKKILFFITLSVFSSAILAQQDKKALTHEDILKWNRITSTSISNSGEFIVYQLEPWKGDPVLKITTPKAKELATFPCATNAQITADSRLVVFTIKTPEDTIRELKLKKTKKEDMPKDKLGIYNVSKNTTDTISEFVSVKIPEEWTGWIAWQTEAPKDTTKKEKPGNEEKGYPLFISNTETGEIKEIPNVSDYALAEEKEVLAFISLGKDSTFDAGIYVYNLRENSEQKIKNGDGDFKKLTLNKSGNKLAFLGDELKEKKRDKEYSLYLWNGADTATLVVENTSSVFPENYEISENGRLTFSDNSKRLFFGTAPKKAPKDSTILEEEIPVLDVWHWNEEELMTVQLNNIKQDLKKSYLAVFHIDNEKTVQLETKQFSRVKPIAKGDADQLLAWSSHPYAVQTMWEGSPEHNDFYLVNINSGEAKMIKKDVRATPEISPKGKYVYWYNALDTTWNTWNIESGTESKITVPQEIHVADELNDIPNPPDSYGIAGWSENDEFIFIYDRFDMWKVNPADTEKPVNLTKNGRQNNISYRLIRFEKKDDEGINLDEILYLKGHNEVTRADSYFERNIKKDNQPKEILTGKFNLSTPQKAKDAEVVVFTKENFETYPNLLATNLKFKNPVQISDAAPQQNNFLWGTAELVSWTSLDGRKLEGTLHKPENFDPTKKYPMIVNFYEKSSEELYSYRMPENHRSTIDYHYYTSNGYIVFNPDVYYKTGYPGEDAFNCVMPGVTALIDQGFVDEKHIGAQGHSWGGYQVAYLATRTNLFAAIESGAPVVNMFSAYGGIRWGSGLNRSFQYEHTQSRIGKSIWDAPLRYLENSPLFTLDKINTPILIMHNDDDGAVPWYQGIEFFIGLRRLQKPAWLLNYNEADHWPLKVRDKTDFQIRMAQFFDYYLKEQPMPKWMKEGIPAVDKGIDLGYELEEK